MKIWKFVPCKLFALNTQTNNLNFAAQYWKETYFTCLRISFCARKPPSNEYSFHCTFSQKKTGRISNKDLASCLKLLFQLFMAVAKRILLRAAETQTKKASEERTRRKIMPCGINVLNLDKGKPLGAGSLSMCWLRCARGAYSSLVRLFVVSS